MSTNLQFARTASEIGATEATEFRVVILYNQPESAHRALKVVDGVVSEFADKLRVGRDVWSFNILELDEVAAEASAAAAQAQLLVIAADGDAELSAAVIHWLERWAVESTPGTAALVAVLSRHDDSASEPSATCRWLQVLAQHAGQGFFAREFRLPTPKWDFAGIQRRATEPSSILLGILEHCQPAQRWGLNE
ncbi:MAG: hypothetical protein HY043_14680 [Verrucomicrobia bacterium]|nr:hypothetical protein [Verrucomicrobiota bacterium]